MSSVKLPPGYLPPTREEALQRAEEAFSAQIIAINRGLPNGPAEPERRPIVAEPFVWVDPATLPRRNSILGKFWPKFLSATIGAGAVGKSSRIIIDAIEIASGRSIFHPAREPRHVWLWNLEDPREELQRRISAAMMHYKIRPDEVEGRLFLNGRERRLRIAGATFGAVQSDPLDMAEMTNMIQRNAIAVALLDPLRNAHQVEENNNTQLGIVCDHLIDIANATGCAIDVTHHPRKSGAGAVEEMTIDDARGGGAFGGSIRAARIVRRMTREEALLANIEEANRIYYFCTNDAGKPNFTTGGKLEWSHLISFNLGNTGPNGEPADNIQVAVPWNMPGALDNLTVEHLDALHQAMKDQPIPSSPQNKEWLGHILGTITGISSTEPTGRKRLAKILQTYAKAGQLIPAERPDPKHPGTQPCWIRPPKTEEKTEED